MSVDNILGLYATQYSMGEGNIAQAKQQLLELILESLPEKKVTTHEYCDAYLNHVDRRGKPLAINHCQHEIDEDNKKIGYNQAIDNCRDATKEAMK